jgi:hypothetical protein
MKKIYDFKKGDEIVRVKPAKEYSPVRSGAFGLEGGTRDRSYMGQKLIFVGIANGQIYCQRTDEHSLRMFGDSLVNLSLDIWDEGWDSYVDPLELLNGFEPKLDNVTIEEQIQKAIRVEDYELAEKLKKKLEDQDEENKD